MSLPPPLIPTRRPNLDILTSSPASSSSNSLFPPAHTKTASSSTAPSTSPHSRFPSVASDEDEFGSFEGHDPLGASTDLLSFSPVDEMSDKLHSMGLLEESKRRDEQRRESLLSELLDQEEGELFGRPVSQSTKREDSPSSSHLGGRPIAGKRRESSSASSPTRPILSPPRRLSHIMSPSLTQSSSTNSTPTPFHTTQEPSSFLSSSTANIYHAPNHRHNAEDFFSPEVRRVSLEARSSSQSDSTLPTHRSFPEHVVPSSLRPTFPSSTSRRGTSSTSPSPSRSSSTSSQPSFDPPRSSTAPTPSPAPSSSSLDAQHSKATLSNLLKTGSRWTSLVSSSLPISNTPAALTHSTPFRGSSQTSNAPYVPPSGAPGFRPDQAGWNTGGWDLPPEGTAGEDEVKLVGRRDGTLEVLTSSAAEMIRPHLPPRQRLESKWSLLYSLDQHGSSLGTLFHLTSKFADRRPESGNVICVRDSEGGFFGGYVNEAFKVKPGSYYGSGECFLFKFHAFPNSQPPPSTAPAANVSSPLSGGFEIFRWTGKNDYFVLCENSFLSVGGGDGKFGLYLDSALYAGSSDRCPAFENDVLCAAGEGTRKGRFECVGVEVWGMGV